MNTAYLDWLTELFEEAQVPLRDDTREYLDIALRRIAEAEDDENLNTLYQITRQQKHQTTKQSLYSECR